MQECQQPKILSVKSCDTSADSEGGFDEIATAKEKRTSGRDIPEHGSAKVVWLVRGLARPLRGLVQGSPTPCSCQACAARAHVLCGPDVKAFLPLDLQGEVHCCLPGDLSGLGGCSSSLLADMMLGLWMLHPSLQNCRILDLGVHKSIEDNTRKRRKGLLIAKVGWRRVKPSSAIPASANSFEIGYPVYALALLLWEIHTTKVPIKISGAIHNT